MIPLPPTLRAALRKWVIPAVLLAAAGASGWVLYDLDLDFDAPATAAGKPPAAPDAWMESFVTVEMDDAGRPERRIEARYLVYNADATINLTHPYYVLHRAEGEPWHVRSKRGQVSADGAVVQLLGEVDIWRNDVSGARDLHVSTEHLTVLPETGYGETAQPVTILMPASDTTGTGMRAFLDESRIELLSQVRTHVHGPRPPQ